MKNFILLAALAGTSLAYSAHAQTGPAVAAPSPAETARAQQLQLLEARTGNTSLGVERGGPYRQLDKGKGGFTVRKFRAMRGQEEERGTSRRVVMGGRTHGKPLTYYKRKRRFLFF